MWVERRNDVFVVIPGNSGAIIYLDPLTYFFLYTSDFTFFIYIHNGLIDRPVPTYHDTSAQCWQTSCQDLTIINTLISRWNASSNPSR